MSRPEHLSCVNAVLGINRINEEQRIYDEDPQDWEQQYEYENHQGESMHESLDCDDLPF